MITIKNISKSVLTPIGYKQVLDGVSFSIPPNSFVSIFGPSGSGKSTLLRIMAGLDRDFKGSVESTGLDNLRIGFAFQDCKGSLLPWLTVEDNITFPLALAGMRKREKKDRLHKLLSATSVEIDLQQPAFSLSDEIAQITSILRALIIDPNLLLLDQPFDGLDYDCATVLRRIVSDVTKAMGISVLLVSNSLDESILLSDQILFLSKSPSYVTNVLNVDLPYPRKQRFLVTSEFNALREKALRKHKDSLEIKDSR